MIRLSIIVPFYNVEQYIEECIRSIYNQDVPLKEYEVICVDDCSPDGSRAIVERLQKEYPTLRLLIHTENKRQGGARNTGLREAKGKYVWFVDADDMVEPTIMGRILKITEDNQLEILQFDYICSIHENCDKLGDVQSDIQTGEKYLFFGSEESWTDKICGPWRQLYDKSFLELNNIRYEENIQYEDTDFVLKAFLIAQKVQYTNVCAYYYRCNSESITHSSISPLKLAWMVNQMMRCGQLVSYAQTVRAKIRIEEMVRFTLSSLRKHVKAFNYAERREYVNNLSLRNREHYSEYMNWRTLLAICYGITLFI